MIFNELDENGRYQQLKESRPRPYVLLLQLVDQVGALEHQLVPLSLGIQLLLGCDDFLLVLLLELLFDSSYLGLRIFGNLRDLGLVLALQVLNFLLQPSHLLLLFFELGAMPLFGLLHCAHQGRQGFLLGCTKVAG